MSEISKQPGRKRLLDDVGVERVREWADRKVKSAASIESPEAICAELGISRSTLTNYLSELGFAPPKGGAA